MATNQSSFKLPKSFLSQLDEFTMGYVLVTVNEDGEFEVFVNTDNPVTKLGLSKFVGLVADNLNNEDNMLLNPFNQDEEHESPDEADDDKNMR